jgi:hypothetical protein
MKQCKSKKIQAGEYMYCGYRIQCCGYYEPEHRIVWQAIDDQTGEAVAHGYTKKEVMWAVDDIGETTNNERKQDNEI